MAKKRGQPATRSSNKRQKAVNGEGGSSRATEGAGQAVQPTQRRARKAGRLARFMNLPLDVWSEVFGHLNPQDLLSLARTNKGLREILMDCSARSTWERARENVPGLPPCPEDMCEPEYANLVFSPLCHFCQKHTTRGADWDLRTRICTACEEREVGMVNGLPHDDEIIRRLIPTHTSYNRGRLVLKYLRIQYNHTKEHLDSLNQTQADEYLQERQKLLKARREHAELGKGWAQRQVKGRAKELDDLRKERFKAIVSRLRDLGWGPELDNLRHYGTLSNHELVKKPQKLTDKIWNNIKPRLITFLEPLRQERLETERRKLMHRRQLDIIEVVRKYKSTYSGNRSIVLPEPADYLEFEPIRALVDKEGDDELSPDALSGLEPRLDNLMLEWDEKVRKDFLVHLRRCIRENHRTCKDSSTCSHQPLLDMNDDDLKSFSERVTTIFRCSACSHNDHIFEGLDSDSDMEPVLLGRGSPETETKILFNEQVLHHQCLTRGKHSHCARILGSMVDESYGSNPLNGVHIKRFPLSFSYIILDGAYGCVMGDIMKAAHKNPESADRSLLDQMRFYCHTCFTNNKRTTGKMNIVYFNLEEMAIHIMESHGGRAQPKQISRRFIKKLNLCKTGKNISLKASVRRRTPSELKVYSCVHCQDLPEEKPSCPLNLILSHLKEQHDILSPVPDQDFYTIPGADTHYPAPFHDFFANNFLVVDDSKFLGDGPEIDWETLIKEQFAETEEEAYAPGGSLYINRENADSDTFESDTENERYDDD